MKAVEPSGIGHQTGPLGLEHRPDCLVAQLGMAVGAGIGDALVQQPRVQLVVLLTRKRGEKNRCRTSPTWFSTWPFSHPDAGVQATGSTR
jgi:hypothetical protein